MKYKKVTRIKEELSALGYGCWGISGPSFWNGTTDQTSIQTIQRAIDAGINLFDVAPVYGFGHAETTLGKAIKGLRDKILIASKCGLVWDEQNRITRCLKPESIRKEIVESLRRLDTDYIDLYQLHWPDPNVGIEETMNVMLDLKKEGKIRYIGLSNFSADEARNAMKTAEINSMQCLYNMLERNPTSYHNIPLEYRTEREILPFALENGLAFLPYSPLFQGLLTGKFRPENNFSQNDVRSENPKLSTQEFRKYYAVVTQLNSLARETGKPLSQIAINWLVKKKAVTSIIAGAQNIEQLQENLGSFDWEMNDDLYARIEKIIGESGIEL